MTSTIDPSRVFEYGYPTTLEYLEAKLKKRWWWQPNTHMIERCYRDGIGTTGKPLCVESWCVTSEGKLKHILSVGRAGQLRVEVPRDSYGWKVKVAP